MSGTATVFRAASIARRNDPQTPSTAFPSGGRGGLGRGGRGCGAWTRGANTTGRGTRADFSRGCRGPELPSSGVGETCSFSERARAVAVRAQARGRARKGALVQVSNSQETSRDGIPPSGAATRQRLTPCRAFGVSWSSWSTRKREVAATTTHCCTVPKPRKTPRKWFLERHNYLRNPRPNVLRPGPPEQKRRVVAKLRQSPERVDFHRNAGRPPNRVYRPWRWRPYSHSYCQSSC